MTTVGESAGAGVLSATEVGQRFSPFEEVRDCGGKDERDFGAAQKLDPGEAKKSTTTTTNVLWCRCYCCCCCFCVAVFVLP